VLAASGEKRRRRRRRAWAAAVEGAGEGVWKRRHGWSWRSSCRIFHRQSARGFWLRLLCRCSRSRRPAAAAPAAPAVLPQSLPQGLSHTQVHSCCAWCVSFAYVSTHQHTTAYPRQHTLAYFLVALGVCQSSRGHAACSACKFTTHNLYHKSVFHRVCRTHRQHRASCTGGRLDADVC
jgi:hypothetical protein